MYVVDSEGRRLALNTDYEASYSNNTDVGTANIHITGKGNYASKSIDGTFSIVSRSGFLTVQLSASQLAVDEEGPTVTGVYFGADVSGTKLEPGTDYTLSYEFFDSEENKWVASPDGISMEKPGRYRVVADGAGRYQGSVGRTSFVRLGGGNAGGLEVSLSDDTPVSYEYDGSDHNANNKILSKLQVGEKDGFATVNNYTYTVSYSNYNSIEVNKPDYGTNNSGSIEIKNAGSYVITVTETGGDVGGSKTGTLTIYVNPRDINSPDITVDMGSNNIYDGTNHANHKSDVLDAGRADKASEGGSVELIQADSSDQIEATDDFYITGHDHNSHIDAGTYPATIVGVGNYTGSRQEDFVIRPKTITVGSENGVIELEYGYSQDAANEKLDDLENAANNAILERDKTGDRPTTVDLYIDANLGVGENQPHVHGTIQGDGAHNYMLDVKTKVTVTGASIETGGSSGSSFRVVVSPDHGVFTGRSQEFEVFVIHGSTLLAKDVDYKLKYYAPGDSERTHPIEKNQIVALGEYAVVIDANDASLPTENDKYTGTIEKTYTVTRANADGGSGEGANTGLVVSPVNSVEYTGAEITPELTVTFDGNAVNPASAEDDEGYTVEWINNKYVGYATGLVDYNGYQATVHFQITPKPISDATVTGLDGGGYAYMGHAVTPGGLSVADGATTLQEGTDYYVTYENNVDPGDDARVVLHGFGNYAGTKAVSFTINKASISGGDGSDPTQPGAGFSVAVYPPVGVVDGTAHDPEVVVTYQGMKLTENADYTLQYFLGTDNVGQTGMTGVGAYTIKVTGRGKYTGSVDAPYTIINAGESNALTVTLPSESATYTGSPITFPIAGGDGITVTHAASGQELEASEYNVVYTANENVGTATVTVTGTGDAYAGMAGSATFEITPKSLETEFVGDIEARTYTGSAIEPKPVVTDSARDVVLDEGVDYTLTYRDNVDVSDGNPKVIVTGRGNYADTVEKSFDIKKASLNTGENGGFRLRLYPATAVATGQGQEPEVVVHYNNVLLTEASDDGVGGDYTVSYSVAAGSNGSLEEGTGLPKDPGVYTVTVEGKNNFEGSITGTFTLTEAQSGDLRIVSASDLTYSGSKLEPQIVVQAFNGSTWVEATDSYSVAYEPSDLTNAGLVLVTVEGKSDTDYAGKSATAAFRINPKSIGSGTSDSAEDITVDGVEASYPYTDSPIMPQATVKHGNKTLTLNKDYTVEYADNLNVTEDGTTAAVTIRGIGNYTGSVVKTFEIAPAEIADGASGFAVSVYPSEGDYTGSAHHPAILVEHNGLRLVKDVDYELKIEGSLTEGKMVGVGVYDITVTGIGNYEGTVERQYEIVTASRGLSVDELSDKTYTGQALKLGDDELTVRYNGTILNSGDYEVAYDPEEPSSAGTVTVTVTGKGDYNGLSATASYEILRKNIAEGDTAGGTSPVTVEEIADQVFAGAPATPEVSLSYGSVTLGEGDCTVAYADNYKAGQARAIITGTGNYAGTRTVAFTILPAGGGSGVEASGELSIAEVPDQIFTGEEIKPTLTVTWTSTDGSASRLLTPDVDYTVGLADNTAVGKATITVTGINNYKGLDVEGSFDIVASNLNLVVTVNPAYATVGGGSPSITVSLPDGTGLPDGGYTLSYQKYGADGNLANAESSMSEAGVYVVTAKGSEGTSYAGAQGTASFVRVANDQTLDLEIPGALGGTSYIELTYNGQSRSEILSDIGVSHDGAQLDESGYTVSISHNGKPLGGDSSAATLNADVDMTNAGVYLATYESKDSSYTGSATAVIVIKPKDISNPDYGVKADIGSTTYDGNNHADSIDDSVTLTDSIIASPSSLTSQTDYDVFAPSVAKNAGSYNVVVSGRGNYTGSIVLDYVIGKKELTVKGGSAGQIKVEYPGPIPTLVKDTHFTVEGVVANDSVTVTLVPGEDATVANSPIALTALLGGASAANYTANVTGPVVTVLPAGSGGLQPDAGSSDADADNDGAIEDGDGNGSISAGGFVAAMKPSTGSYTGHAYVPEVTVSFEGAPLEIGRDFSVSYLDASGQSVANMIDVGEYTVRVILGGTSGNYAGAFDFPFSIVQGSGGGGGGTGGGSGGGGGGGAAAETVTLVYVVNGGYELTSLTLDVGSTANLATPLREGWTFEGWYWDAALTDFAGDAGDAVVLEGDCAVYAKWTRTSVPGAFTTDHVNYVLGREGPDGQRYIAPESDVTRAEVAAMVYRLLDSDERARYETSESPFPDVDPNAWYGTCVATLTAMGAIHGYPDGAFRPDQPITRAELIAIVTRLDDRFQEGVMYGKLPFTDVPEGHWAEKVLSFAANVGWLMGDGILHETVRPDASITRAETMAILNRMLQRLPYSSEDLLEGRAEWPDNADAGAWYWLTVEEATNNHDHALTSGDHGVHDTPEGESQPGIHERWTVLLPNLAW